MTRRTAYSVVVAFLWLTGCSSTAYHSTNDFVKVPPIKVGTSMTGQKPHDAYDAGYVSVTAKFVPNPARRNEIACDLAGTKAFQQQTRIVLTATPQWDGVSGVEKPIFAIDRNPDTAGDCDDIGFDTDQIIVPFTPFRADTQAGILLQMMSYSEDKTGNNIVSYARIAASALALVPTGGAAAPVVAGFTNAVTSEKADAVGDFFVKLTKHKDRRGNTILVNGGSLVAGADTATVKYYRTKVGGASAIGAALDELQAQTKKEELEKNHLFDVVFTFRYIASVYSHLSFTDKGQVDRVLSDDDLNRVLTFNGSGSANRPNLLQKINENSPTVIAKLKNKDQSGCTEARNAIGQRDKMGLTLRDEAIAYYALVRMNWPQFPQGVNTDYCMPRGAFGYADVLLGLGVTDMVPSAPVSTANREFPSIVDGDFRRRYGDRLENFRIAFPTATDSDAGRAKSKFVIDALGPVDRDISYSILSDMGSQNGGKVGDLADFLSNQKIRYAGCDYVDPAASDKVWMLVQLDANDKKLQWFEITVADNNITGLRVRDATAGNVQNIRTALGLNGGANRYNVNSICHRFMRSVLTPMT